MDHDLDKGGKLVIVPTPIGNLGDMTKRAADALEGADVIFSEDTRMTRKLIFALGLEVGAQVRRLDQNVMSAYCDDVADLVSEGLSVAYCTDAGMPGISDPGMQLVAHMQKRDLPVEVLPGANAATVAYVASGTDCPHFYFGGFLPRKRSQAISSLKKLAGLEAALIFHESPNRIASTLEAIAQAFPQREVCLCRELTKLHEEVIRADSGSLASLISDRAQGAPIKGECVIVVDAPSADELDRGESDAFEEAAKAARVLLDEGLGSKEAASSLVRDFGLAKNDAYDLILSIKNGS